MFHRTPKWRFWAGKRWIRHPFLPLSPDDKKDEDKDDKKDKDLELDINLAEKDKPKTPSFNGSYKSGVRGTHSGSIQLTIKGKRVSGNLKGRKGREKFTCGFSGSFKGKSFTASGKGSGRSTRCSVRGTVSGKKIRGSVSGTVNGKSARMSF